MVISYGNSKEEFFNMGVTSAMLYVGKVREATRFICDQILNSDIEIAPEFAITLGSGLGELSNEIVRSLTIPYSDIPHFPHLSVPGHAGELIVGRIAGIPVIGLSGRKHYYEVAHRHNGIMEVVFPVHVMANLGVRIYFATNAVGGLNLNFKVGDLMVVRDHIDLFMPDPLVGPHLDFGENLYFQPQSTLYNKKLSSLFLEMAEISGWKDNVHRGIYTARTGRTYETAATSQVLRRLGADAVGMSVIPEVIVAANRGMETMAVSIITNKIAEDGTNATSHEEVMATLNSPVTKARVADIFTSFFTGYNQTPLKYK